MYPWTIFIVHIIGYGIPVSKKTIEGLKKLPVYRLVSCITHCAYIKCVLCVWRSASCISTEEKANLLPTGQKLRLKDREREAALYPPLETLEIWLTGHITAATLFVPHSSWSILLSGLVVLLHLTSELMWMIYLGLESILLLTGLTPLGFCPISNGENPMEAWGTSWIAN